MGSSFNPQILVEKLAKLNCSQQSIETLSHWCIFHMNKAKLVVDTWDKQFHSSPRERRLAFLYLANDILQNSRKKGVEFVAEFWRVLPEALRDVVRNGDECGKNVARRLVNIWDERNVFGSRVHILKEEFVGRQPGNINRNERQPESINRNGRQPENNNRNGRQLSLKSTGDVFDRIVSDYEVLYGGQLDEDALLSRCTNAISNLEKLVKDIGSGTNSGKFGGSGFVEELRGEHASLRECIQQLTALESSRASLVLHLRVALQEQESKLDQVRSQLRGSLLESDQATNFCRQFLNSENNLLNEQGSSMPPGFTPEERQVAPVVYTRQAPLHDNKFATAEDDSRKSAAAAVAAKLTASTASAEMLSHVLTSLVSGVGLVNNSTAVHESPGDHHQPEKRPKVENDSSSYASPPPPSQPQNQPPPPLVPFPHPDPYHEHANNTPTSQPPAACEQPPPPSSSPPPLPPLPPMLAAYPMAPQFIQAAAAGSMSSVAYSYGAAQQPPPPHMHGYPGMGPPITGMCPYLPPINPYQNFPGPEGGFYSPPSSVPMAPMPHQQSL